jgi:hypothetical protein
LELAPYLVRLENCKYCREELVDRVCSPQTGGDQPLASAQDTAEAAGERTEYDCRLELAEQLK